MSLVRLSEPVPGRRHTSHVVAALAVLVALAGLGVLLSALA